MSGFRTLNIFTITTALVKPAPNSKAEINTRKKSSNSSSTSTCWDVGRGGGLAVSSRLSTERSRVRFLLPLNKRTYRSRI